MIEIVTAFIGGISLIAVAIVERRTRKDEEKWEQNSKDHQSLVERMENIGNGLGRSLDRVEDNLAHHIIRLENKVERHDEVLFGHLADHATVSMQDHHEEKVPLKRKAK